jgi:hypothetical protein
MPGRRTIIATLANVLLAGVFAGPAFGQTSNVQPDVSGTWIGPTGKIILTQKDGSLRVQSFNGDKSAADYTCNLDGRECAVKEAGRPEKVMVYFNGPKLVEIKEHGNDSEKRRFTLSADGKTLQVEMIPLSSEQKPETLTFQREGPANGKTGS